MNKMKLLLKGFHQSTITDLFTKKNEDEVDKLLVGLFVFQTYALHKINV